MKCIDNPNAYMDWIINVYCNQIIETLSFINTYLSVNMVVFSFESESQVHEMSAAASGYYKVVKENRTLYNMVQDLKG